MCPLFRIDNVIVDQWTVVSEHNHFAIRFQARNRIDFLIQPLKVRTVRFLMCFNGQSPYVPLAALPVSAVRPNALPYISELDPLVFKINSCGLRPSAGKKIREANDAPELTEHLSSKGPIILPSFQKDAVLQRLNDVVQVSAQDKAWWMAKLALNQHHSCTNRMIMETSICISIPVHTRDCLFLRIPSSKFEFFFIHHRGALAASTLTQRRRIGKLGTTQSFVDSYLQHDARRLIGIFQKANIMRIGILTTLRYTRVRFKIMSRRRVVINGHGLHELGGFKQPPRLTP